MPNNNQDKYFLASIVESSHDSIITINLDMEITSWNKGAEELYGYPASEAIGKSLTALTLAKDFQQLLIKIEKIKASKQVEVFESERVGKDKSHMILEVVVSPVLDEAGEVIGVSTIARDLTARRVAEKAMHDKEILHRLIIAQEDERSRISRDLHDELGQQMTSLRLTIDRVTTESDEGARQEGIAAIAEIAKAMDSSIDFLAWELRPAQLEGVGLSAAVGNYLDQWSRHAGVEAELLASGMDTVPMAANVETNLYRIVQEALNNTHKHAKATRVEVILEHRDESIILVIVDNGVGFSLRNKTKRAKGLGLTGMRERASLIGGTLNIESTPGRGTTIHVRLPVSPKKKRKAIKALRNTDWGDKPDGAVPKSQVSSPQDTTSGG